MFNYILYVRRKILVESRAQHESIPLKSRDRAGTRRYIAHDFVDHWCISTISLRLVSMFNPV